MYWPDLKTVTVERNLYFNNSTASHFEEEDDAPVVEMNAEVPVVQNQPAVVQDTPVRPVATKDPVVDITDISEVESLSKRVCKLSKKIINLLEGEGSWSTKSKTKLAPGMQEPSEDWAASVGDRKSVV